MTQSDAPTPVRLSPVRALSLPLAFALGLMAFGLLEPIRQNPRLLWSFLGAGAVLVSWSALLLASAARRRRTLTLDVVLLRQHYLQACAQGSVLLYWGWHWPQVYESAPLIAGQLLFAYGFDLLLGWSRRDSHTLGFGPFPVIFSINLFLWFKQDWFYLQFLMVAVGLAAKELIRWNKEGRRVHIFNPSSFPLAIASIVLILTGTSDITWGQEIAVTQFFPPHIYLMLFLIGLPGQYFFGVTTSTMSAVIATYLFGLLYFLATGTYFFFDSYIPIAVFLGMHLLFNDPSTSPRTELGRIMFGAAYGLSTVALYALLGHLGVPTFYDKLLQVPILNLSVKWFDRVARSPMMQAFDPARLGRSLAPRARNLAYMSVWTGVFVAMSAVQGVGDSHPGQWAPFWQQACGENRPYACGFLADMESRFCTAGSGWGCNALGVLQTERRAPATGVAETFQAGCALGFSAACGNLDRVTAGQRPVDAPPTLDDYPIILRGGKGPITSRDPLYLYARACTQGWRDTCGRS